ncbi:mismatch repair endonuclease PMS2 isoform X1 [Leptinotarsa decemlineata]|uniref:mismatch repair endonuclease PMS2 isoform X1 n=2 Tax=Leptinotarsa decemlineata TaxID=7539 RepID=UPI003D304828
MEELVKPIIELNSDNLIKAINRDTVHRICSGQVVLSLAIAMKELVENSIDAGATIVNIHLVEYGSELLEVSDNGSGVMSENFKALTLKHYTSKISKFSDLQNLGTLGFRGEALSSLCALSDLMISTRHELAIHATKITYNRNGEILSQITTAREQGTTVTLKNLFSSLPVRRKEFMKNLKREFSKMCQLLYAYCLVSKGIKFTCTNVTSKGVKTTVVATDGKQSVRENVINIFGSKQISSLIDVEVAMPDDHISSEFGVKLAAEEQLPFTFEFLISSVTHGSGRSATDRQFYYINSRPVEPTKIMKLVNETYKQFNCHQYPFVYLNIVSTSLLVDVNVTPDKRQVFVENEKILLATIKQSLLEAFKTFPSTYKMQNLDISKMIPFSSKPERGIKRSLTEHTIKNGSIREMFKKRSKTDPSPRKSLNSFSFFSNKISDNIDDTLVERDYQEKETIQNKSDDVESEAEKDLEMLIELACQLSGKKDREQLIDTEENKESETNNLEISLDQPVENNVMKKSVVFNITLDQIKKVLETKDDPKKDKSITVKFRSEISPDSNKSAEEELQKQIQKTDFSKMEIVGQFNLGFIITKLSNDLFIIDQHATDEKYNFEQLQLNTVIDSQVLVNPKALELTTGSENLLIENLDIFKKNGFSFIIDESAPCTKKVHLTAIPVSRNFVFGKDDIDEMLFMLQGFNHKMCRPSRVRAMFASRACRSSVMIGKHLSKSDMRRLVDHMGQIDQPWNCPHGRPTMRHLINLDLIGNPE